MKKRVVLRKVAAVLRPSRFILLAGAASFFFFMHGITSSELTAQTASDSSSASATTSDREARTGSLDLVLLLDKSLSMEGYFMQAKEYAAGQVLGPILVPGDRLIVELVYGKVERLITMDIGSEADKAKAIRAIRGVKADGRFTDLGKALDAAKKDLDELGKSERPKYVLMITDERQEAPEGSPYRSTDYTLRHPSLEYVKKEDLGDFRAITVGLQVGDKVAQAAPEVMKLLLEPPVRDGGAQAEGAGSSAAARAAISAAPSWALYGAAGLFVLAGAGLAAALAAARKRRKEKTAA